LVANGVVDDSDALVLLDGGDRGLRREAGGGECKDGDDEEDDDVKDFLRRDEDMVAGKCHRAYLTPRYPPMPARV
jgi:hypothetical protein